MEPIKQEIINNIFENGDKLITGPILQTVLIDMIDDVNVKDQEILSKTGSWDEAATQIPNLATKEEVTNLSESVARDLENVVDVDLTGYATEQWVQNQGYLTEHQDISNLATKTELTEAKNNLQGNITNLSESVARDLANVSVPEGVATEQWVQSQDYASKTYVNEAVSSSVVDLTGYATETWVESQGYLKEHQDISNLATKTELTSVSESIQTDISNLATKGELNEAKSTLESNLNNLSSSVSNDIQNKGEEVKTWVQNQGYLKEHQDISGLATKAELNSVSESVQTDISNLSESVANSAVWKKGEGQDSIVQILTGDNETKTPKATGTGSIAIGLQTTASGNNSHAEGWETIASGLGSHAEGIRTKASGYNSHTEGQNTKASNDYSHAEGDGAEASGYASHAEGNFAKAKGYYSHAEGQITNASGQASHAEGNSTTASAHYSHAEGFNTITSNQYEHAQGQYNYTSSNQIFSVGAGEKIGETVTRRNAVSILEVPNSETQVITASFFVQNIGGYDGTNPTPGTNDLATVINNLPSGGSSETLWEKGTGTDSIVQAIASETDQPTATGDRATATGFSTKASGYISHAEGDYVEASGWGSHAEGHGTNASGEYSHAEGKFTIASNESEHAQGRYNHSSENQIFSIGTGNNYNDRRNAVSVLEVDNSGSYTSSFFVQNIGGYDGTNPEPGTNDLATVINNLPSGGGSSETLWKKGEGQDSIVQKVTDTTLTEPIASGIGAVAIGDKTRATGQASHAEGYWTVAEGNYSHAEGRENTAKGVHSHTEGFNTIASNDYEHAQGIRNYNSTNQIFSVGAGDYTGDYVEASNRRRNAISVLAVPNSDTQVVTASFFVQNIGGYDGTNPLPGTNDLATVINGMSTGGGSSETLWKKGTGFDSIVQILTGDDEAKTPTASGTGSVAIGYATIASGQYSHAEEWATKASGWYSHAEGYFTEASSDGSHAEGSNTTAKGQYSHAEGHWAVASGECSHAEGQGTKTSNEYEHAQGRYNHSSTNQIFSIGTGNSETDRRNAVSVLEVDNSGSYTSSFFVQNVGGYDGTNPTPGTNDLATVLNNTETWTFTLEDGSTVTKNVRIS